MRWIRDFTVENAVLDFTSSGQGKRPVTQIRFGHEIFANAVELTSWDEARFQTYVCGSCGFEGCAEGDWWSLRRAGADVVWLPEDDGVEALTMIGPTYARLREVCRGLPELDALPAISD